MFHEMMGELAKRRGQGPLSPASAWEAAWDTGHLGCRRACQDPLAQVDESFLPAPPPTAPSSHPGSEGCCLVQ